MQPPGTEMNSHEQNPGFSSRILTRPRTSCLYSRFTCAAISWERHSPAWRLSAECQRAATAPQVAAVSCNAECRVPAPNPGTEFQPLRGPEKGKQAHSTPRDH